MSVKQAEDETGVVTTACGGLVSIRDALRMAETAHPVLAIFDHHGRPLHLGRAKRLASADQRLALIAASHGCTRPGCDACHALVHEGPGGGQTRVAPADAEYPGRTEWIPPPHIDPERTPRVNHRHHLGDLLAAALAHYRARRDTEMREHLRRWLREPAGDAAGGEVP
ncbi:DUF222 domain-containing protein [Rhodococcus zopfii]